MYKEFYGFAVEPFTLNPDPRFLYMASSHFEAFSSMMSGIQERKGIIVITGEAGVGKTTLIHALLKDLSEKIKTAFIFQPKLDFQDLLKNILRELEVPIRKEEEDILSLMVQFRKYLDESLIQDDTVTIVIDEAQSLDEKVLEDLGRLTNPDTPAAKLLQILLVGQPELEVKLNSEKLRPLKERVTVHRQVRPLTQEEGREYIKYRLKVAGRDLSEIFASEAVDRIWEFAEGIPRVMNLLCDRALLIGFNDSAAIIDLKIVKEAMKDFSYLQPPKSEILRPAFLQLKAHYKVMGIFFLLVLGFGVYSLFPRDFSLPISKMMVKLLPWSERPIGIGGSILPPEERPVKTRPKALPSPDRSAGVREEKVIQVQKGWSLSFVARQYYPVLNSTLLDFILEANPQITDSNLIFPYQKIKIPKITEESLLTRVSGNVYHIHVGTFQNTHNLPLYKDNPVLRGKTLQIIPRKISPRETWYRIVAGEFNSKEEALRSIQTLKQKKLLPLLECLPNKTS